MAEIKDAPAEKKARTRPLRMFTSAIVALEERLVEDLLDEDVETALLMVTAAYTTVQDLHRVYLAARQPDSESEELEDNPNDVKWMDKVKQSRAEVLAKYREWKKGKADKLEGIAAAREEKRLTKEKAEELKKLIRMMEAAILGIGDPERLMRESLEREVSVDFIKKEMQDI